MRGMSNDKNAYLSDEGMPNRPALPLGAQKILHVSCRIGDSESGDLYLFQLGANLNIMQDAIN